ncbi:MAG: carbohydrate kinase family protein [Chitinophagaceae bacterium]|nr:carbohydrate kinase family protein [Chitinophagaceae bacterium]MCW5928058.1 carbohydrate kinase family protein [Chitinophagaceae bacterium]
MKINHNPKFDVIVVGELNIDLILNQVHSFPEIGKEKFSDAMTLALGSSSAIFASNLSSLGLKVAFIGKIGDDIFGRFCKEQLEVKGVDTSMIMIDNNMQTGATIVLNFGEDRANITHQGVMKLMSVDDITGKMLSQGKHLHFSSYFFQPGFRNGLNVLFQKAKEIGLTTSLDIQWDPMERWDFDFGQVLPLVDVFMPNENELLHLTGQSSIEEAIKMIASSGCIIVVKRGTKGSLLSFRKDIVPCAAFVNNDVVDAIGAGDSFNAGFIFSYLKNRPLTECQTFANLMGAISTMEPGGTTAFVNYGQIMKIARERFGYAE